MLLTFGDISHHGPVLLAWVLLQHTLHPEEVSSVIRRLGHTTLQLGVFQYLTNMLQALGSAGNNVRTAFYHCYGNTWITLEQCFSTFDLKVLCCSTQYSKPLNRLRYFWYFCYNYDKTACF